MSVGKSAGSGDRCYRAERRSVGGGSSVCVLSVCVLMGGRRGRYVGGTGGTGGPAGFGGWRSGLHHLVQLRSCVVLQ